MQNIPIDEMREAANRVVDLLKVLSNPQRILLLCEIAQAERNVGELEKLLDIRQPTLSQQLGVLRRTGMVETRRDGKQIYYQMASQEALTLMNTLYELFCMRKV